MSSKSNEKWNDFYNQKAWIRTNPNDAALWPGYIYDSQNLPSSISQVLKNKAKSLINKKYIIKYFGMHESESFGFIPRKDLTIYQGDNDPLYDQKPPKRYGKQFQEGLTLMRQILDWGSQEATNIDSEKINASEESFDIRSDERDADNIKNKYITEKSDVPISSHGKIPKKRGRKPKTNTPSPINDLSSNKRKLYKKSSIDSGNDSSVDDNVENKDEDSYGSDNNFKKPKKRKLSQSKETSAVQRKIKHKKILKYESSDSESYDGSNDEKNDNHIKKKMNKKKINYNDDDDVDMKVEKIMTDVVDRDTIIARHIRYLTTVTNVSHITATDIKQTQETIDSINKLNLTLSEITASFGTVFSQLRNHTNATVVAMAKQQIKKWKTEHSEAIAKAKEVEKNEIESSSSSTIITSTTATNTTTNTISNINTITTNITNTINTSVTVTTTANLISATEDSVLEVNKSAKKTIPIANNTSTNTVTNTIQMDTHDEVIIPLIISSSKNILSQDNQTNSFTDELNNNMFLQKSVEVIKTFDSSLLPVNIFNDIVRLRAVRLLMSVSVPDLTLALYIEKLIYDRIVSFDSSTMSGKISSDVNENNKDNQGLKVMELAKPGRYTSTINRIAFALNEPEMQLFKDRLLVSTNLISKKELLSIISITELPKLLSYCSELLLSSSQKPPTQ